MSSVHGDTSVFSINFSFNSYIIL